MGKCSVESVPRGSEALCSSLLLHCVYFSWKSSVLEQPSHGRFQMVKQKLSAFSLPHPMTHLHGGRCRLDHYVLLQKPVSFHGNVSEMQAGEMVQSGSLLSPQNLCEEAGVGHAHNQQRERLPQALCTSWGSVYLAGSRSVRNPVSETRESGQGLMNNSHGCPLASAFMCTCNMYLHTGMHLYTHMCMRTHAHVHKHVHNTHTYLHIYTRGPPGLRVSH